jgi:hypothetical protein
MRAMLNRKRIFGVFSAALLLAALIAAPAHADLLVNAGTLDFDPAGAPTIGDFSAVTLDGTPQLTSLTVAPFTIIDSSGTASGWNVLLTVPDLVNDPGTPLDPTDDDTILASNVSMSAPIVTPAAGASMTGVAAHVSAGGFNAGEKIVTATAAQGEGTYLVSPRILKLTVPDTALVGTYVSAGTVAVVSGP